MDLPPDYHMHTPLCRHATGEPLEYAEQARKTGLTEIGFSDHSPMEEDDFDNWRMRLGQLNDYVEKVEAARRTVPEVTIRVALEVDYLPGHEKWIRTLAGKHPWDYLIGSVHYISDTWAVDDPSHMNRWKEQDPYEVWSAYFGRLTQAARSGLFDIIGHCDLPKKFGIRPERDCSDLFETFLKVAAESETAIELNTAGLRKDCREIYPSGFILKRAHDLGVRITFGSDAHAPKEVGHAFKEAIELAWSAGYRSYCRFDRREFTMAPLTA